RLQLGPGDCLILLVSKETDGHYLTAYTTSGSCSILMRFSDAVADLGELGMRVHRSYWVARHHVIESTVRDNRVLLRLTGGYEVPVSRTYAPAVQAAIADHS
ncbi:MAG: LytTR family DNA-binding domain-containing protein, partial [Spirochaetaceae bacterium]|nr:LytTR family DNA-binding domain-containing protein [Spirochaetaceae bacterium]